MWEAQRLTTRHEQDGKVIRSKKKIAAKRLLLLGILTVPLVVKLPEITPLIAQFCSWGMEAAYDVFK